MIIKRFLAISIIIFYCLIATSCNRNVSGSSSNGGNSNNGGSSVQNVENSGSTSDSSADSHGSTIDNVNSSVSSPTVKPVNEKTGIEYYPSYGDISGIKDVDYSPTYSVKVNGKSIDVLRLKNNISQNGQYISPHSEVQYANIAMFAMSGVLATVEVTVKSDINSVVIRPLSKGIEPTVNGQTITFTLTQTNVYLSIEVNDETQPLFLFVDELEIDPPTKDTPGVTYFGPGVSYIGPQFKLADKDIVYLAPGAIVNGSFNTAFTMNVTIEGRGILNGSNWLRQNDATDFSNYAALNGAGSDGLRVDGITLMGHNNFTTCSVSGKDMVYNDMKIVSFGLNSDGTNLFYNTQVSNCFMFADDDLLRMYSGADGVLVNNVVLWKQNDGNVFVDDRNLKEVKNISFNNVDVIHNETPSAGTAGVLFNGNINLKYLDEPCYMSNIRFNNIHFEQNNGMAVEFDFSNIFPWYLLTPKYQSPNVRDILFSNITAASGMTTVFKGLNAQSTIQNIFLNNFRIGNTLATSPATANMATNSFAAGIQFNQGMVALTSPDYNGLYDVNSTISIAASTYDFSSSVSKVDFYVDNVNVGTDTSSPFCVNWKATQGHHTLKAVAASAGKQYSSSQMTIGVGQNILKNGNFENSDMSMWSVMDKFGSLSRTAPALTLVSPDSGNYYAKITGDRDTYGVIQQDVTSALMSTGKGTYGIQASISYRYTWGGTAAVLKIDDDNGTHYYKSRGASLWNNFWATCDNRFQNVTWTGTLKSATFYIQSTDETTAASFPNPQVLGDTYVDNCMLSFIQK